jgi:hypothetical protein
LHHRWWRLHGEESCLGEMGGAALGLVDKQWNMIYE